MNVQRVSRNTTKVTWWLSVAVVFGTCLLGVVIWSLFVAPPRFWERKKQETIKPQSNKDMAGIFQSGVPNHLVRDDGSYNLVAIIDGAAANRQFIANLQVINSQRQALGEFRAKIAALPKNAPQVASEDLGKKSKDVEALLTANMEFMRKNYGYSALDNYILVPLHAEILEKGKDEKGNVSEDAAHGKLVKVIDSTEGYERFERLRAQQIEALRKKDVDASTDEIAKQCAARLDEEFGFKAGGNYILQIVKGVLYSKVK